jgi:hypothetical protein
MADKLNVDGQTTGRKDSEGKTMCLPKILGDIITNKFENFNILTLKLRSFMKDDLSV